MAACMAFLLSGKPMDAAERQVLSRHVPDAVASSRVLKEVARGTRLDLAIGLPLRNQAALDALLVQLADPTSPNYKHYLTPAQFAAQYGPTVQDYQAMMKFAKSNGLTVTATHSNCMLLDVSGDVADVENVFNVKMMVYKDSVRGEFYAPDSAPSIYLDTKMSAVSGLDNFVQPRPMGLKTAPVEQATAYVTGSGPAGYFIGKDFRKAYAPDVTATGAGQTVGLLEFDGFYAGDVQKNAALAGLAVVPTQTVLLDGFNGAPGSSNIEVILDIMMASYMAPGLSKIIVYEGYYPNDVLNRMATDNLASQLSSSWGFGINATTEQIFKQFIAQGQSLLQASGDGGAYTGVVMTPSDDPNVTVVGGTSLTTMGSGGTWTSESTWSGSGGGVSTVYPIPSYQQGMSMTANGGSTKMRNLPDVGLTADIQMYLIYNNGQPTAVGGTSAAAPLWAGFIALANQQGAANGKSSVGFLNPLLYTIGKGSNYTTDFHDIKQGSNSGFSATTGYDLTTGWGSPAGQHLIYDLTGTTGAASFGLSNSVSALTVKPSGTGAATVTVGAKNGFSGSVGLAVTGLPSGVTAAFSPVSTSSTSTVTFTASATAVVGTYPLTITGTTGSLSSTATIALTVAVPSFTLSASAASLSVPRGGSGVSTISVSDLNGFNSSVTLAASGLPTGVTATFSAASTSATSVATFTASSTAVAGNYPITVTGTSGTLKSTTTIAVTVTVPSFSLSASAASLTIPRSSSGTSTISVSGSNGFNSSVTLAASGLPSGVTAAFSAASTSATSVMTFTASSTAAAGTYPITVTGTSGTLSSTTTIAVTVTVPSFSLSASAAILTIARGGSGASTINVSGLNGFAGTVSLTTSVLPNGVTAVLSPASTTKTSTVTFAVSASSTVSGSYPITVTGTSGTLSSTTAIAVTVTVPSFSVLTSTASLSVPKGSSGVSAVSISGQNGFNSSVSLVATGLPSGVTAVFNPASTTTSSTLTFTASASTVAGTYPITVTGTSTGVQGTLKSMATITLTITTPNFTLSFLPGNVGLARGFSASSTLTVTPVNGFKGTVALGASGLPSGATAAFGAVSAAGTSQVTFTANSAAALGTFAVTVSGVSGSLTNTVPFTVTVLAPTTGASLVNLSSVYNVNALVVDGLPFTGAGLDGGLNGSSTAYSANLVGVQQTIAGNVFYFGPANELDAVSSQVVPLPASQFSSIQLVATGVNGYQPAQVFKVTYTDGTVTTFTQNMSDWFTPQSFSGETKAMTMAYRNNGAGQRDNRTFYLYEYSFALNSAKTVASITLPNNRNVVVLSVSMTNATSAAKH
jgi:hypothetical protein